MVLQNTSRPPPPPPPRSPTRASLALGGQRVFPGHWAHGAPAHSTLGGVQRHQVALVGVFEVACLAPWREAAHPKPRGCQQWTAGGPGSSATQGHYPSDAGQTRARQRLLGVTRDRVQEVHGEDSWAGPGGIHSVRPSLGTPAGPTVASNSHSVRSVNASHLPMV